ncbi:MAG: alcohol dehydrogenase catalytic domain-containing protein [Candidatus Humimicrobiaceae bacterium]
MSEKMLAAVFKGEGRLVLEEVDIPVIDKDDEILIKVDAVSICGTDVHIVEVPPGYIATPETILGHELTGIVEKTGRSVKTIKIGDRVVVNPNDYCCVCKFCKMNLPNLCENIAALGIHVNGGFAKYCKVTEKVCHRISMEVLPEEATFAEPLACVINGTEKIRPQPGETAMIFGGGPIGLLFLKMLKTAGVSKVILCEVSKMRLEFAKNNGADLVINMKDDNFEKILLEETPFGVDIAVDSTGSLFSEGIKAVRKGGKFLVFGVNTKAVSSFAQSEITFKEIQVLGTWLANGTFPKAVKLIETGVLNLNSMITDKLHLGKIKEGINLLK